ncbi:MAG: LysM peptidoglycan-binding protein [Xanthomonadaceae bacterium]|nr:LysM peptidoglycan-binding protein [Xanthomonadaceae bacterium]
MTAANTHGRICGRLAAIAVAVLMAGCASTQVVRGPYGRPAVAGPVRVSAPKYGATASVHQGDTLYRIATDNGISALDLAMWNSVPPPYTIHPGQRLRLYPSAPSRQSRPAVMGSTPGPAPTHGQRSVVIQPPAVVSPVEQAPAASGLRWVWPADGTLAGRFVAGEPTQQGIDVSGQAGQPVRAAADGVVVYSGSGLVGYGELVIVKHNDSWLSAYGHNRARLVNEGQRVTAGQQIAEMGHSGASRDELHFEIRFNGKPVDPLQYLPRHD